MTIIMVVIVTTSIRIMQRLFDLTRFFRQIYMPIIYATYRVGENQPFIIIFPTFCECALYVLILVHFLSG